MSIGDLRPYERNPRNNDAAVDAVAESIREFGFKVPIVVDRDGVIVAGHTRFKAAKKLHLETVPVVIADDLTDEQVKAFRLADNKTGELAEWDWNLLDLELSEIQGIDMELFGFEEFDVETGEPEAEDDGFEPDPPVEPKSRLGDVYRLGGHVLVVGDSTDPDTVSRALDAMSEGAMADMLLTDPPYNIDYTGKTAEAMKIDNDSWGDDEGFVEFLTDAYVAALSRVRNGGSFYIWHASTQARNFLEACSRAGMTVRQTIIWNKSVFTLGRQDYQWKHEPCLYGWKDGAAHYFTADRTLSTVWSDEEWEPEKAKKAELVEFAKRCIAAFETDVWDCEKPSASRLHPTMKPIPLMARAIVNSTKKGDIVLDTFGGSGSTLMACEQMGRRCATIELDPAFADVIVARWEEYTGKEAVRIGQAD